MRKGRFFLLSRWPTKFVEHNLKATRAERVFDAASYRGPRVHYWDVRGFIAGAIAKKLDCFSGM